jgi:hypothetical protein
MKKMKRFNEGDVVEFETKQGPNEAISKIEGIHERAMKAVAEGGQKDKAPAPKKAAPKVEPKAAPKSQPESDREENSDWMRQFRKDEAASKKSAFAGKTSAFKKMASGGKVSSASSRADGCATKGKTKGTMISMCGGGKM